MWLFESILDVEGIKKYTKSIEKIHINDIVKDMATDYLSSSKEEKFLIKYRIENILNSCKQTKFISIFITLVVFIIFTMGCDKEIFKIGMIFIAIVIVYYLICSYRYFKVCKLYLKVIEDAEEGKIELKMDSNKNRYILFN